MTKSCCFIGSRNTMPTIEIRNAIKNVAEDLITNNDVTIFNFGSKSNFNNICLELISELKKVHKPIKRIAYLCPNETAFKDEDKVLWGKLLSQKLNKNVNILCVDQSKQFPYKTPKKGVYISRNFFMIDNSDYCVFHFENNKKEQRNNLLCSNSSSGTSIAYKYAIRKNKKIILV